MNMHCNKVLLNKINVVLPMLLLLPLFQISKKYSDHSVQEPQIYGKWGWLELRASAPHVLVFPGGVLHIVGCWGSSSPILGVEIGNPVFFRGFFGQNLSLENTWCFLGIILVLIRIQSQFSESGLNSGKR